MEGIKTHGKDKMAALFGEYESAGRNRREGIINEIIATAMPEAARFLVKIAEAEKDQQLRAYAINGFLTIHPRSVRDDLIRLAGSEMLEKDEFADMIRSVLIRAVGLMDDPSDLDALKKLEKRVKPVRAVYYSDSLEFNFLATYARLGDDRAARKLVKRVLNLRPHELPEALGEIGYCRSLAVAEGLSRLFGNNAAGSRIAPYFDYPGGQVSDEEATRRRKLEENAHVRIKDDALCAIVRILAGEEWGFDPEPKRRYSEDEFMLVMRKIGSLKQRSLKRKR